MLCRVVRRCLIFFQREMSKKGIKLVLPVRNTLTQVLSTTLFNYDADSLMVSQKWWILPTATLPLMVIVFAAWLGWQKKLLRKNMGGTGEREKTA